MSDILNKRIEVKQGALIKYEKYGSYKKLKKKYIWRNIITDKYIYSRLRGTFESKFKSLFNYLRFRPIFSIT